MRRIRYSTLVVGAAASIVVILLASFKAPVVPVILGAALAIAILLIRNKPPAASR
jgi:hypothetical protein